MKLTLESATGLKVSSFMGLDARAVSSLPFLISAISFEALYQQNSGETVSSDGCGNRFANQNLLSTTREENLAKIVESVRARC